MADASSPAKRARTDSDDAAGNGAGAGAGAGATSPAAAGAADGGLVKPKDDGFLWVLGVDGSKHSRDAFAWMGRAVGSSDAVHIVSVVENADESSPRRPRSSSLSDADADRMAAEFESSLDARTSAILQEYANEASKAGFTFSTVKLRGAAVQYVLRDYVDSSDADNLVVAMRGLGDEGVADDEDTPAGSVSEWCVRNVLCNVIVVKDVSVSGKGP